MVLSFLYNDFVHLDKDKLEHNFLARWRSSIKNALTDTVHTKTLNISLNLSKISLNNSFYLNIYNFFCIYNQWPDCLISHNF